MPTLNEMRVKVLELFPHSPVSSTIFSRNLDASLVACILKLFRTTPTSWNTEEDKEEKACLPNGSLLEESTRIFGDTARTQDRSIRRTRAVRVSCSQRTWTNSPYAQLIRILGPLHAFKIHQAYMLVGMSKERFSIFLESYHGLCSRNQYFSFIFDNAPPHRHTPDLPQICNPSKIFAVFEYHGECNIRSQERC